MLKVLVVYAVEEERVHLSMAGCGFRYVRTGVGKINAALAVEKAVSDYQPDVVMNIGTAGSVHHPVGSIHLCKVFADRDMEKLKAFNVPYLEDFSDLIGSMICLNSYVFDSICNTGDSFLTEADGIGDVFDMESYAVARVCRKHQLPFMAVKYVTDIIGQNSVKHWEDKLAEAQHALQQFMDSHPIGVASNHMSSTVLELINSYHLAAHPEGGWFSEVYRSDIEVITQKSQLKRKAFTSIYYLLCDEQISTFHRLKSPETWCFLKGQPLVLTIIEKGGEMKQIELSNQTGGFMQYTIEAGDWFAAGMKDQWGFALTACAVAPGFEYEYFEIASREKLVSEFPQHKQVIEAFTR